MKKNSLNYPEKGKLVGGAAGAFLRIFDVWTRRGELGCYITYFCKPGASHPGLGTTVCPGSSDPFYIVSDYIKWVTTSWTHSKVQVSKSVKKKKMTYQFPVPWWKSGLRFLLLLFNLMSPLYRHDFWIFISHLLFHAHFLFTCTNFFSWRIYQIILASFAYFLVGLLFVVLL